MHVDKKRPWSLSSTARPVTEYADDVQRAKLQHVRRKVLSQNYFSSKILPRNFEVWPVSKGKMKLQRCVCVYMCVCSYLIREFQPSKRFQHKENKGDKENERRRGKQEEIQG